MLKYTVRRLIESLIMVLIIVSVTFVLMRMLPTDMYFTEEQMMKLNDQQKEEQLEEIGRAHV